MRPLEKDAFWLDWFKEELTQGRSVVLPCKGYSMYPAFKPGEKLIVEPFDSEKISLNDVLVFENENQLIAHRLISFRSTEGSYLTQGDSCLFEDNCVEASAILGKITFVVKNGRKVSIKTKHVNNVQRYFWRSLLNIYWFFKLGFINLIKRFNHKFG